MIKENLLGKTFNRFFVIIAAPPVGKKQQTAWFCRCDCGNYKVVKSEELKNGGTKSCGCLLRETNSQNGRKMVMSNTKYHPSETTARRVWRGRYKDGLSFEDFYKISQYNCYYCNGEPNNIQNSAKNDEISSQYAKDNGDFTYNGLDRVDNSKIHIIDNVVPCCKWCNFSKRERSTQEFLDWLKRAYEHNFINKNTDEPKNNAEVNMQANLNHTDEPKNNVGENVQTNSNNNDEPKQ